MEQFDWYQKECQGTRLPSANTTYCIMGISGEVGELLGYFAKVIRDKNVADRCHVKKELGDIMWFVASIAEDYGIPLSDVVTTNLTKLQLRKAKGTLQGSGDDR